jgi:hypothetical protein
LRLFSSPQRPCWQLRCLRTEALAFVKLARVYNNPPTLRKDVV